MIRLHYATTGKDHAGLFKAYRDYYIRLHLIGIFLSRKQAKSYTASSGVPMVLLMLAAHHALPAHISQGEPGQHQLARLFTDALRRMTFFVTLSFLKGNMMNSNQKGDQGNKQSGSGNKQSGSPSQGSKQGGTHEQHVDAGRQSHKNDGNKQSGSSDSKQSGSGGSKSGK